MEHTYLLNDKYENGGDDMRFYEFADIAILEDLAAALDTKKRQLDNQQKIIDNHKKRLDIKKARQANRDAIAKMAKQHLNLK